MSLTVVLDTNVWISGVFFRRGPPARVLEAWRDGQYDIVVSALTLAELGRKLREKAVQFGFDLHLADEWLAYIGTFANHVAVSSQIEEVSRDATDDPFLDAAIRGRAAYLVTGDKDLLVLEVYRRIKIITPREFLEILAEHR
jgi:putative PIN family toxin of toxin-antitoxin system